MYSFFFKTLQKIMWLVVLYWFVLTISYFFTLSWLAAGFFIGLAFYLYRKRERFLPVFDWLMGKKGWLIGLVVLFQLAVVVSSHLLVRRDAAVVLNGAFEQIAARSISNYLTRNPNNLFLFLYERGLYRLFGEQAIWLLQLIGLLAINSSGWLLYQTAQSFISQKVGNLVFTFYLLVMGFSPYVIQTYTDVFALPFLTGQLYLLLRLIQQRERPIYSLLLLGVVTALALTLRPTAAICLIAFFLLVFLKGNWRVLLTTVCFFGLSCGLVYGGLTYLKQQQTEVQIIEREELTKSWRTFVNLGLTFSGTDQGDMKKGLERYVEQTEKENYNNGMFADANEIKEIQRRLSEYTIWTFSGHILYKLGHTLYDGTLNWLYTKPEKEKSVYLSPLYDQYTKQSKLATIFRETVIETDGRYYLVYQLIKQAVWLVVVTGLCVLMRRYRSEETIHFLVLALFGGILFLMVFEGGKTRYLVQFLPQILLLASIGLAGQDRKENL